MTILLRSIQPVGSKILSGVSVAGHTWDLWKGPNSNWQVLSFVSQDGDITNFNADLKEFFDYIVQNQGVSSSQVSFTSRRWFLPVKVVRILISDECSSCKRSRLARSRSRVARAC